MAVLVLIWFDWERTSYHNGTRGGEHCVSEELAEKKCFARLLCPELALQFYGLFLLKPAASGPSCLFDVTRLLRVDSFCRSLLNQRCRILC